MARSSRASWGVGAVALGALIAGAGYAWAEHRLGREWSIPQSSVPAVWPLSDADLERVRADQIAALVDRDERRRAMAAGAIGSASSGASIRVVPFVPPADPLAGVNLDDVARREAMDRGAHLVETRGGCAVCHGDDLAGGVVPGAPWPLRAPNITPGGVAQDYQPADWERLLRHGVNRQRHASLMPATATATLSDQEVSDIITFVSSVPPVDDPSPVTRPGLPELWWIAAGWWPLSAEQIDHHAPRRPTPPVDDAGLGAHLGGWCASCHDVPALNTAVKDWSKENFVDFLHSGARPAGSRAVGCPTRQTSGLTRREATALWTWLGGR